MYFPSVKDHGYDRWYTFEFRIPGIPQKKDLKAFGSRFTHLSNETIFGLGLLIMSIFLKYFSLTSTALSFVTTFAICMLTAKVVIYSPDSYNMLLSRTTKEYWLELAYTHIGNSWGLPLKVASVALLGVFKSGTLGLGLSAVLGLYQGAMATYVNNRTAQESSRKNMSLGAGGYRNSRCHL